MIKGAVFDMDGLMFDTERLVFEIWREMTSELGLDFTLDVFKQTIGLRRDESEKLYKSFFGDDFDYSSLKLKSRKMFMERINRDGVPMKKGLIPLLDYLKSNKIKLAVATSTSAQTAHKVIRLSGVYDYFDSFVCGEDVSNGKPAPDVFLKAGEKIGIKPEDCVAFEDSINGIKSAYSAGMKTVMVPDLLQPTDEIMPMINCMCKSLDEAIAYIDKNLRF